MGEITQCIDSFKDVLKYTNFQISKSNKIPTLRRYCSALGIEMYINWAKNWSIAYLNNQETVNSAINKFQNDIF